MSAPGDVGTQEGAPADAEARTPADTEAGTEAGAEADERASAEARARLRRGRLVTALVAAVLAAAVGVVALLGGFEPRTDEITRVAVGSTIVSGPYEVTLERATVQHRTSNDEWDVVVRGTARTTGTTSISPSTGDDGFLYAKDPRTGEANPVYSIALGTSTSYQSLANLTPGLPAVPWALTFRFHADPGGDLIVAVFDQEYTTPYLFSDEQGWRATGEASTMDLPLERLPDKEY